MENWTFIKGVSALNLKAKFAEWDFGSLAVVVLKSSMLF